MGSNVAAALAGTKPRPFRYRTLGVFVDMGQHKAVATMLGVRLRGFPAWFAARTYHLCDDAGHGRAGCGSGSTGRSACSSGAPRPSSASSGIRRRSGTTSTRRVRQASAGERAAGA